MIKNGQYNTLRIARFVDFGAYLTDDEGAEVLLPIRYLTPEMAVGDELKVFVYNDSEDRLVAVTDTPLAVAGEFAFLQVVQVNRFGAFLDWGLPKDLLVPYSEQRVKMSEGGFYPVYVYVDHESKRVVASAKLEKYLDNAMPRYRHGDRVKALVWKHTPLGYKVIVDNLFTGMIYNNEIFAPLELEQTVEAYVKTVRDDGKIDLTLSDKAVRRIGELSDRIYDEVKTRGSIAVSDSSDPEEIKALFQCSKKDFKKAVGKLYKDHKIVIGENSIALVLEA